MTEEQVDRVLSQVEKLDSRMRDIDTRLTKLEVIVGDFSARMDRQNVLIISIKSDLGILTNIQYRVEQEEKQMALIKAIVDARGATVSNIESRIEAIDEHVSELVTWKTTFWHRVLTAAIAVSTGMVAMWNWILKPR